MQFSLTIDKLGSSGDGIGTYEGKPVFVPFALPGETVRVEKIKENKTGITAHLNAVEDVSADRVEPKCQHFTKCGGCQAQHMSEELYKQWMKDKVIKPLTAHNLDPQLVTEPVLTSTHSRRRLALKARKTEKGTILGFNMRESHTIVNLQECIVAKDELVALFNPIRAVLDGILPKAGQAEVHLTSTKTGVDILFKSMMLLTLNDREDLTEFAAEHDVAAIHWDADDFLDPVLIRREPMVDISGVNVSLPPAGFIQASEEGQNHLVQQVISGVGSAKRVADLFSGIGTFTFPLAAGAQVLSAEGNKPALDSLIKARNISSDLKQIITRNRDLFRNPLMANELDKFDAIVIDPPRTGAREQVEQISLSGVSLVVSISCNPNTFARDAEILTKNGYKIEKILLIDQFLYSQHVEVSAVIRK